MENLNLIWAILTVVVAVVFSAGGAWIMVKVNAKEIVRVETESEGADGKIEQQIKDECRRIEELIGNLRVGRELKVDQMEKDLEEITARFTACRSGCPDRIRAERREIKSEMDAIRKAIHRDDGVPRFVPMLECHEFRDDFKSQFKELNEKIDSKEAATMGILKEILHAVTQTHGE